MAPPGEIGITAAAMIDLDIFPGLSGFAPADKAGRTHCLLYTHSCSFLHVKCASGTVCGLLFAVCDQRLLMCDPHSLAQDLVEFELLYLAAVRSRYTVDIFNEFRE